VNVLVSTKASRTPLLAAAVLVLAPACGARTGLDEPDSTYSSGGSGGENTFDTGYDSCGALVIKLAATGCVTFDLPPTGSTSCASPLGDTVTGPSFAYEDPPGVSVGVHVSSDDSSFEYAEGPSSAACNTVCSTGGDRGPGGGFEYWESDEPPMRIVLRASAGGHPFHVRLCAPENP
jgi:hypothetical protein